MTGQAQGSGRRTPRYAPKLPSNAVVGRPNQYVVLGEIMADPGLSATTKIVAWAVYKHLSGETGWTWTGNNGIAADLSIDRADAVRHLAALEGGERSAGPKSPKRSQRYVYSTRFGPNGHEQVYRCFLQPEWVSDTGGNIPPGDETPSP